MIRKQVPHGPSVEGPLAPRRSPLDLLRGLLALEPTLHPITLSPSSSRRAPLPWLAELLGGEPTSLDGARWGLGKLPRPSRGRKELVYTVP